MNIFRFLGIGADKILEKNCHTSAQVTLTQRSYLYVIKKPVRLYPNEHNTRYSNIITFRYTVDGQIYTGKLFVSPYQRCPQKGETIDVYYDPENPKNYACYFFGPANATGW